MLAGNRLRANREDRRMAHERAATDAMDVGDEAATETRAMDGVSVKMLSVLQH